MSLIKRKGLLSIIIIILALVVFSARALIDKYGVTIDKDIISSLTKDETLMNKIGGYKEHIFL